MTAPALTQLARRLTCRQACPDYSGFTCHRDHDHDGGHADYQRGIYWQAAQS